MWGFYFKTMVYHFLAFTYGVAVTHFNK